MRNSSHSSSSTWRWGVPILACGVLAIGLLVNATRSHAEADGDAKAEAANADKAATSNEGKQKETPIRVAQLHYLAGTLTSECFAEQFLTVVDRQTKLTVDRSLAQVRLDTDDIYEFPLVIMSGEYPFELPEDEAKRLRDYLERGGFLLASAGCSNMHFKKSFEGLLDQVLQQGEMLPLNPDHPLFRSLHEIKELRPRRPAKEPAIYELRLGDRMVGVYSPLGLNDTGNVGGGCCCCGGNELRDADLINANILTYVLTH